jgi:hypothetical protein
MLWPCGEALYDVLLLIAGKEDAVVELPFGEWHSCANAWHSAVFPGCRPGLKSCANGCLWG